MTKKDPTPIDDAIIRDHVRRIVKERGVDWIPDPVEERIYTNAIVAIMRMADEVVNNMRLSFLGHELHMDLVKKSAIETRNTKSEMEDGMVLRSGKVIPRKKFLGVF